MLYILSNFLLRLKLREKLKQVNSQSKTVNKKFQSLLIICSEDEPYDDFFFLKLARQFGISTKKTTIIILTKKELVENQNTSNRKYFFTRKSIGFFGKIPKSMRELFQRRFDLQINYFNNRSIFSEVVSVSCQSKLRVGFSKSNQQINDLILDIDPKEHNLFLKETKVYLNALLN